MNAYDNCDPAILNTYEAADKNIQYSGTDAGKADAQTARDATSTGSEDGSAEAMVPVTPRSGVKVDAVPLDQVYPGYGCGTHPNAEQQEEIATAIAPIVKSKMGW